MKLLLMLMIGGAAAFGRSQWAANAMGWASCLQSNQKELAYASKFRIADEKSFANRLSLAALEQVGTVSRYDSSYVKIPFPNGDVPEHSGNNADFIVRTYRTLGVDLQAKVYLDMLDHGMLYPRRSPTGKPDTNIDHRSAANLRVFFSRRSEKLPVSKHEEDYEPGDIITCKAADGMDHIAIVVPAPGSGRPWIVHNINAGPRLEDRLFDMTITGHFRYAPGA